MNPLRHRASSRVDRVEPPRDTEEYKRALAAMKRADRWLEAVMKDADRVFKRGVRPT